MKLPPRPLPNRDAKYMGLVFCIGSFFSKDPHTQIGAFVVNEENEPLGFGFNGPPRGINDNDVDWSRPAKYDFMIHAEINAMRWARRRGSLNGATLYVTAMPCKKCMLEIVAEGIKKVVYFPQKSDKQSSLQNQTDEDIAKEIAKLGKLTLVEFKENLNWMRDRILDLDKKGIFG
jgi:dCMP deaminase